MSRRRSVNEKTTERAAGPQKPDQPDMGAQSGKLSIEPNAGTSQRPAGPPDGSTVKDLAEIELETGNLELTGAVQAAPGSDFEGLSRVEDVDSESVDELVEEGNVFEAGAVAGVERADHEDEREVRTRQLPENDVPDEYLEMD
jgi:hypothetical protein